MTVLSTASLSPIKIKGFDAHGGYGRANLESGYCEQPKLNFSCIFLTCQNVNCLHLKRVRLIWSFLFSFLIFRKSMQQYHGGPERERESVLPPLCCEIISFLLYIYIYILVFH